jgi:hypothetical protein
MFIRADQLDDNLTWRKSSDSGGNGGDCVETTTLPDGRTVVRNSKTPADGGIAFLPAEWAAFVKGVKNGEFG